MRLLHISDTHGFIPKLDLDGIDAVIHSGDFAPNKTRGWIPIEESFQRDWYHANRDELCDMVPYRIPFLVCRGNHDFTNPADHLGGMQAYDLSNKLVEIGGLKFFGFPYTPWFTGEWWGELTKEQEEYAMEALLLVLERDKPDVFVSHGPMYGVLDQNLDYEYCGSSRLRNLLMHQTTHLPKVMLHGHIHESAGKTVMTSVGREMRVYNSATIVQVVEV